MPNWCENQITISGDKDKMKPIVDVLQQLEAKEKENENAEALVMESLLGTEDRPKNYEEGGWYDYNVKKFGTKWDFQLERDANHFEITDDSIFIDVMTAWSPPQAFLQALCEKYGVNASINFAEPGMDFAGSAYYTPTGVGQETTSTYLKGVYDNDMNFMGEVENQAYMLCEEENGLEQFKNMLSFLPEDELEEAIELFNEVKEEQEE